MYACYFYPIFSHFYVYVHGSLTQTCVRALAISLKLPQSGSYLYEKRSQKQRCRCDNAQVAPTQWSDYAMLTEHWICQVSFWQCRSCSGDSGRRNSQSQLVHLILKISVWQDLVNENAANKSSGERLFDTGERLSPTSACSLTGYFGSLPFS